MKKVFYILMCVTLSLPMVSCGNKSSNTSSSYTSSNTSSSYTSPYKSFETAINDGSVYPGMTYEQIKEICGEAEYLSYAQGKVSHAYYGRYQVCFDPRDGRFDYYNITNSY